MPGSDDSGTTPDEYRNYLILLGGMVERYTAGYLYGTTSMSDTPSILVPVSQSATLRQTVAYAVAEAREAAASGAESATVHFVYPVRWREPEVQQEERTRELLDQVAVWAEEDLGRAGESELPADDPSRKVRVETAIVGRREHLFSPGDYARVIHRYASANGVDRVVLDPEYTPAGSTTLIDPLRNELERDGLVVEEAPVERPTRRGRLAGTVRPRKFLAVFGLSYAFYLLLGDPFYWFDLVTGVAAAGVTAATLSRVTFLQRPRLSQLARQLARFSLYAPYLLWEIAKANVEMAFVILHPSLPIDPRVVEYDAAIWGSVPSTTLANSITLTPGTLTVDIIDDVFHVHALVPASEEGLLAGSLERSVRFVFYGRSGARIPTPRERREAEQDRREAEDARDRESTSAEGVSDE